MTEIYKHLLNTALNIASYYAEEIRELRAERDELRQALAAACELEDAEVVDEDFISDAYCPVR